MWALGKEASVQGSISLRCILSDSIVCNRGGPWFGHLCRIGDSFRIGAIQRGSEPGMAKGHGKREFWGQDALTKPSPGAYLSRFEIRPLHPF
ncbi:hypothetical protein RESH_05976 [Rhodopirellula europaea SH398]|uniref:Uncharacterized protein n=1 Tax=Rhodopirellula europaea SH398 TaxID=1263868 RepID=M5RVU4_9BACT|nr:hypothetical protein RESH_05976 [Rhodopirellula europaea SH398]